MEKLQEIRQTTRSHSFETIGIPDSDISNNINSIKPAIILAYMNLSEYLKNDEYLLSLSEKDQIEYLQRDILNFYKKEDINPYVPLAANGPWIITTFGSVIYDSGSYGMLSFGHRPKNLLRVLEKEQTMANVMTAQLSQVKLTDALNKEIGSSFRTSTSTENCYSKYIFLNSGSEAVALALRLSDAQKKVSSKIISLENSFHGRLDRGAQVSGSTIGYYKKYLSSFSNVENIFIRPNDINGLIDAFRNNYIEAVIIEPVLGEGVPGLSLTKEFYITARKLTQEYDALLIVDSVQAGLRTTGYLSVCDSLASDKNGPDIEIFSKAINAGQFPLSILALNEKAVSLYKYYIYGNTMTTNPRGLDIATEVLLIMPNYRENIVKMGSFFLNKLEELRLEFPDIIESCNGTGLILSFTLKNLPVSSIERILRINGLGVIHGANNSIRFTPNFKITTDEIELIISIIRSVFSKLKIKID